MHGERYTPENVASRCRATGIRPLDNNAIRQEKPKPSLSYTKESTSLDLPATATPITVYVPSIFQHHFQAKLAKQVFKGGRLRSNYYGKSMTSEEAVSRLQRA